MARGARAAGRDGVRGDDARGRGRKYASTAPRSRAWRGRSSGASASGEDAQCDTPLPAGSASPADAERRDARSARHEEDSAARAISLCRPSDRARHGASPASSGGSRAPSASSEASNGRAWTALSWRTSGPSGWGHRDLLAEGSSLAKISVVVAVEAVRLRDTHEQGAAPVARRVDPRREAGGAAAHDDEIVAIGHGDRSGVRAPAPYASFSIVSASLTSNLPGASTLTAFTVPSSTSME